MELRGEHCIYIDESGSINNNLENIPFVIAMIYVHDDKKRELRRAYRRFISSNYEQLIELDRDRINPRTGQLKSGGKMFCDNKFHELKGAQFDRPMKINFVDFFSRNNYFDIFYLKIDNHRIKSDFCKNRARSFNYLVRLALGHFISKGYLPVEDCHLQLDERNEKPESKYFLEDYLNTELVLGNSLSMNFTTEYFDSANNCFVQIADVFSNIYYSHLITNKYSDSINKLVNSGILKDVFEFPPSNSV